MFYDWAYRNGYEKGLTIDRINNNGNYCPENCRWTTNVIQANNKRNNILIKYKGELMCIGMASRLSGINYHTLYSRVKNNCDINKLYNPV